MARPRSSTTRKTTKKAVKKRGPGRPKGSKNKPREAPKKRGRPKGSRNKPKAEAPKKRGRPKSSQNKSKPNAPKKRGRPKGSKNKPKADKAKFVKQLESDILNLAETDSSKKESKSSSGHSMLEQIMFKIPQVDEPLIGTPKQVQSELDSLAIKMQRSPDNDRIFNRIHLYMHGYLINVVLKKFPFIRGFQTVDIYQETLIALRFKSIPNFKRNRGMSFLNFSKMCIRRHLITLLNASKNRKRDQSMNQSISLDSSPLQDDEDGTNTFANIITDKKDPADKMYEQGEAFNVTKLALMSALSEFECLVLEEYLSGAPYKEIAKNLAKKTRTRYSTKSVDNALLRIRKKAFQLMKHAKVEDLPMFMKNK